MKGMKRADAKALAAEIDSRLPSAKVRTYFDGILDYIVAVRVHGRDYEIHNPKEAAELLWKYEVTVV